MAQFGNLPDIIVQSIYRHAIRHSDSPNHKLVYLSICSPWRKALSALVYSHVVVVEKYGININLAAHSTGMEQGAWNTNLDLVEAMDNVCHVRTVTITIFTRKGLFDFIKNGGTYFGIPKTNWSGVSCLEMNTNCISFNGYDTSLLRMTATDLSNSIAFTMPSVTSLLYNSGTSDYFAISFCTNLVQHYACNLRRLVTYSPIELSPSFMFQNLRSLEIRLDRNLDKLVAIINIQQLKELALTNLSANFTWNIFTSGDGLICFTNLGLLSLDFESNTPTRIPATPSLKAQFPILHTLQVRNYPNTMLFANCELSDRLGMVRVFNSDKVLAEITTSLNSHSMDSVCVEVSGIRSIELYSTLNRLFGKSPAFNRSSLDISIAGHLEDMDIDWSNLSRLTITSEHTYSFFFELISQLPSLEHIGALSMVAGDMHYDSRFEDDEYLLDPALSINSSIRSVVFRHMNIQPKSLCLQAIIFLLRRLPNIRLFMTTSIPPYQLHASVLKECAKYPHLSQLDVMQFTHSLDF